MIVHITSKLVAGATFLTVGFAGTIGLFVPPAYLGIPVVLGLLVAGSAGIAIKYLYGPRVGWCAWGAVSLATAILATASVARNMDAAWLITLIIFLFVAVVLAAVAVNQAISAAGTKRHSQ